MLFFLESISWYLHAERDEPSDAPRSYAISLTACVLAALSKGSALILPPLLLLIVRSMRPLPKPDLVRIAPFWAVAALLVPVNVWFQARISEAWHETSSFTEHLLGAEPRSGST